MALNLLSIKYPQSDNFRITASEIAGVNPECVELSEKGAEVARRLASSVSAADCAVTELKALDRQIADLMNRRAIRADDVCRCTKAASEKIFGISAGDALKVAEEFQNKGFTKRVKGFVKAVRDVLFDDSKKEYRDILCVGVSYDDSEAEIDCEFEHGPTGNCFKVSIPAEAGLTPNDILSSRYAHLRRRGEGVKSIDVVFAYSPSVSMTIISHYDVRVIKQQLDYFIARGCVPIESPRGGYIKRYLYGDDQPMDMLDYHEEAM